MGWQVKAWHSLPTYSKKKCVEICAKVGNTVWINAVKGVKGLCANKSWWQKRNLCFNWEDFTISCSNGMIDLI